MNHGLLSILEKNKAACAGLTLEEILSSTRVVVRRCEMCVGLEGTIFCCIVGHYFIVKTRVHVWIFSKERYKRKTVSHKFGSLPVLVTVPSKSAHGRFFCRRHAATWQRYHSVFHFTSPPRPPPLSRIAWLHTRQAELSALPYAHILFVTPS